MPGGRVADGDTPPAIVLELAKRAISEQNPAPNPIAWNVGNESVLIVFEDGRKITYERGYSGIEEIIQPKSLTDAPRSHPKKKEK